MHCLKRQEGLGWVIAITCKPTANLSVQVRIHYDVLPDPNPKLAPLPLRGIIPPAIISPLLSCGTITTDGNPHLLEISFLFNLM